MSSNEQLNDIQSKVTEISINVATLTAEIKNITESQAKLYKQVNGNGQPGLITKVDNSSRDIVEIKGDIKTINKTIALYATLGGIVITGIFKIITHYFTIL